MLYIVCRYIFDYLPRQQRGPGYGATAWYGYIHATVTFNIMDDREEWRKQVDDVRDVSN